MTIIVKKSWPDNPGPGAKKRPMRFSRALPCLFCGLLAGLLVWLARDWTPVRMLEAKAYDARIRAHAAPLPDPPLIVTLNDLDKEPKWHDKLAELLEEVREAEPRAVLLDVLLTKGPDYELLAEAVLALDPILICYPDEGGGWVDPDPLLAVAVTRLGHVDPDADFDGVVRTHRVLAGSRKSAAAYLAGTEADPLHWIRYSGPPGTIPTLSWQQVLHDPGPLRGRLVLLGMQSPLAEDWARTPFDAATGSRSMSGVEVLAQTVQSLRSPPWRPLTELGTAAVILALGLLGGMSALLTLPTQTLAVILIGLSWLGLSWYQQLSPTVPPLLSLALGAVTAGMWRSYKAERGSGHLRRLLSRYVAEPLARELLQDPAALRLGGQRRTLTVLFAALDGFTPLALTLEPEAVMELLNQYYARAAALIDAHHGTLKQFVGGDLRVIFNAPADQPDHARRAVLVAVELERALGRWMAERADQGLEVFGVSIGIHTGEAVLGYVGTGSRAEYSAVGDFRTRGERGVPILISRATAEGIGEEFPLREHGEFYEVLLTTS